MQKTSKQCNLSIVCGKTMVRYRFLTGFYGLGDLPNEFQRVIISLLRNLSFAICYIDDTLVASKGSLQERKTIVKKFLKIPDKNNVAVKRGKCAFF